MLTFTISGWNWPDRVKWTNPAMRKAFGGFTITATGTIATGDIAPGAITPALVSPGAYSYAGSTYATKTYTVGLTPILSGLANGVRLSFKAAADCEDGPILMIVNGLGPKKLLRGAGVGLVAGDIRSNSIVEATYNTSLDTGTGAWEITSIVGNPEVFVGTSQGSSTATAHVVTSTVPAKSFAGLAYKKVLYVATVENSGVLTLNVDGLGAKAVLADDGMALKRGDIKIGDLVGAVYVPTASAGAGAFLFRGARPPVFTGVDAGANDAYAVTLPSFPAAWVVGTVVAFKANTSNTGPATLTVTPQGGSALTAVTLKKFSGKDLDTNDILAGQWVTAVYDGTNLQVQSCGDMIASAEQSILASAGVITVAHGLASKPRRVRCVLVAQATTDHGFTTGDEVGVEMASNTSNSNASLVVGCDATNVWLVQAAGNTGIAIVDKASPSPTYTALTAANWKYKFYYAP